MNAAMADEFASHIRSRTARPRDASSHNANSYGASSRDESAESAGAERSFRKLWELSELSAGDFADEVARFYALPGATLPELLAARPLVHQFSRRFLREMTIFPCQTAAGTMVLAVA